MACAGKIASRVTSNSTTVAGRTRAVTCSPKCRTHIHRSLVVIDRLIELCPPGVTAAMVLEASAISVERPDLFERIPR